MMGLRVRISIFYTREQIPVGFEVVPAPVPAGINSDLYPCQSGLISAGTRIFPTHCRLRAGSMLNAGGGSMPCERAALADWAAMVEKGGKKEKTSMPHQQKPAHKSV